MHKKLLLAALSLLSVSAFAVQQVTIMSFNIRTATPKDGLNAWEYRREACVQMLDSLLPDVFGMQEVMPEQEAYVTDHLSRYAHVAQGRRPGLTANESCPIYWRKDKYNLLKTRTFWLSETPLVMSKGWDAKYERVATYVLLQDKATAKQFIVFNTHLDHMGVRAREESMRMIADTLRILGGNNMPMFVMGDMNVTPDDASIAPIYDYMQWSQQSARVTTSEHTFTGFDNSAHSIIDYIFYRNAIAEKFQVVKDQSRVPYLSDHRPILCSFDLSSAFARQPLNLQTDEQIDHLMQAMTLSEKVAILHAWSKFSSPGVPRLGIPGLWCSDGPHGVRSEIMWDFWTQAGWTSDSCTAFPALTCLAATWNPEMAHNYGVALGEEALYRRKDVLLGPGVNMYRTPLNGRNFEYMGEDPVLAGQMAVPYIQGVQSNGVATCVKHFALNNQEDNRLEVNVTVDERALYEYYLPAFKTALQQGGSWSVMGSYNLWEHQHCCHNHRLLIDILRDEWHYDGTVVSDWGGTRNRPEAIHNGLDLEMGTYTDGLIHGPSNAYHLYFLSNPYLQLLKEGKESEDVLNVKVKHVLKLISRTSANRERGFGRFTCPEHSQTARQIADEGIVLLKNNGILPLNHQSSIINHQSKILVVGENAIKMMSLGGGSSELKTKYEILPLDGLKERFGNQIRYVRGYVGDTVGTAHGITTGQNLRDDRSFDELKAEAVDAAKEADVVIFIGGLNKAKHQDAEGNDRQQYNLPYRQDELIEALAEANKNLVVVAICGNAFAMPWLDKTAALVQAWFLGSESGHAMADILSGDVCPSGKLPYTILPELTDYPAHQFDQKTYPGVDNEEVYTESFYVGYRYADLKKKVTLPGGETLKPLAKSHQPIFPFGFGLSYTQFAYGKPTLSGDTLTLPLTNTGTVAGKEVVQLYVSDLKSSLPRPVKELKAFQKVALQPGETAMVQFIITDDMLSFYNDHTRQWVIEPGKFELLVAASSADIRYRVPYVKE